MAQKRFCKHCLRKLVKSLKNKDPRMFINFSEVHYKCLNPIFDYDEHGEPVVFVWDCKKEKYVRYTKKEYDEKFKI